MSTILMALSLGTISMIVVLISGLASGVVRFWTLVFRCGLAFCLAGAACYFLLLFVEMYYEKFQKEKDKIETELAENEEENQTAENENVSDTNN